MKILSRSEPFAPPPVNAGDFFKMINMPVLQSAPECSDAGVILFTPQAQEELDRHIQWGRLTNRNHVEQLGLMIGRVCRDEETGAYYAVCERLVPVDQGRGTGTFFKASHEVGYASIEKAHSIMKQSDNGSQLIGWYHTHPLDLTVFISGVDDGNHKTIFDHPWQFAVVLNPQRRVFKAFVGLEHMEVNCIFPVQQNSVFYDRNRVSQLLLPDRPEPSGKEDPPQQTPGQNTAAATVPSETEGGGSAQAEDEKTEEPPAETGGEQAAGEKTEEPPAENGSAQAEDKRTEEAPSGADGGALDPESASVLAKTIFLSFSYSANLKWKKKRIKRANVCIKCDCSFSPSGHTPTFCLLSIHGVNIIGKDNFFASVSVKDGHREGADTLTIHYITKRLSDRELNDMLRGRSDEHTSLIVFSVGENDPQEVRYAFRMRNETYTGSFYTED